MPIVPAKCTCCGAVITVDDSKEALICESCNSAFIVKKAIELYEDGKITEEFETVDGVLKKYNGDAEDVTVPDGIKRIGGGAFLRNSSLKSVVLPKSVAEIGDYAFAYCENLSKVTYKDCPETDDCVSFSENLSYIGDHAFRCCYSLPPRMVFACKDRIYHDGDPVFRHCYEEAESVTIMQKGHNTPRLYSKLGSFDMELTPLSYHLFGRDFDVNKVKYLNGRDGKDKGKPTAEHESKEKAEPHRVHRSDLWKERGRCAHCGGEFNILKRCKSCGRKKDY